MKTIIRDILYAKEILELEKVFLFGSFVNSPKVSNDIDIIFYTNNSLNNIDIRKINFSKSISRIQYNCYRTDYKSYKKETYDIVLINKQNILNKFIQKNKDKIMEI